MEATVSTAQPQVALSQSVTAAAPTDEQEQEAVALKKALEWELSLDSRDLRSHAWYHGQLQRQRAEEIVQKEGDFLIRDCASQPDNYVLTCYSKGGVLHFVINKILLQPETVYERVQYQFEEDAFDAVPDLITFYVGSGKPISAASGACIQFPCNRSYPLSFYGHKIVGNHLHTQMLAGLRGGSPLNSPLSSNGGFRFGTAPQPQTSSREDEQSLLSSPPRIKRDNPPKLPSKKQRSQSLTPAQAFIVSKLQQSDLGSNGSSQTNGDANGDHFSLEQCDSLSEHPSANHKSIHSNGFQTIARCNNASEVVDQFKFTTHSLPRPATNTGRNGFGSMRVSTLTRDFSLDAASLEERVLTDLPERAPSPPPKPMRAFTLTRKDRAFSLDQPGQQQPAHLLYRAAGYHASGSDSGNGSGDSLQSSLPGDVNGDFTLHRGVIIKNPRFMSNSASSATLKSLTEFDASAIEEKLFTLELPEFKNSSCFDTENFATLLLPVVDNKPLDGDALNTFKIMLLETGPKMIAEHITRIDIALLIDEPRQSTEENVIEAEEPEQVQQLLNFSGLEMLTLPQGRIFRADLIERTQCIKLMVAVTILTCHTDMDRAELLSRWIQIAVETKTALGNLYGFCAIMLGLCMHQVSCLSW